MRSYTSLIKVALLVAPMLSLGCGSDGAGGGGGGDPKDPTIPSCKDGEFLSTNASGQLICRQPPSSTLPVCNADSGALTSNGKSLGCTDRNVAESNQSMVEQRIRELNTKIMDISNRVTVISSKPGARATYVGSTTMKTNGRVTKGNDIGLAAAAGLCSDQFTGSHLCTAFEMYASVYSGKITTNTVVPRSWIYNPQWTTISGADEPSAGLNDNCASMTYPTADKRWAGTVVGWENVSATSRMSLKFFNATACNQSFPLACCK